MICVDRFKRFSKWQHFKMGEPLWSLLKFLWSKHVTVKEFTEIKRLLLHVTVKPTTTDDGSLKRLSWHERRMLLWLVSKNATLTCHWKGYSDLSLKRLLLHDTTKATMMDDGSLKRLRWWISEKAKVTWTEKATLTFTKKATMTSDGSLRRLPWL
jgi:hypothetical protein